jgi:superfamily II DNA or RNA helicase
MSKITWITGPTGSGKTYKAISEAQAPFAFLAPTRLLAMEAWLDYGREGDALKTGVAHIEGTRNLFATYQALSLAAVKKYKTVIIDEAHWVDGEYLGQRVHLRALMAACRKGETKVTCLSATVPFEIPKEDRVVELPAPPMAQKEQIDLTEATERIGQVPTLILCTSWRDVDYWQGVLSKMGEKFAVADRRRSEYDIFTKFLQFRRGKLNTLITSNIAQQGVNLPCENLILAVNDLDGGLEIAQKIGRLGRRGKTREGARLTWAADQSVCVDFERKKEMRHSAEKDALLPIDLPPKEEIDKNLVKFLVRYKKFTSVKSRTARHGFDSAAPGLILGFIRKE